MKNTDGAVVLSIAALAAVAIVLRADPPHQVCESYVVSAERVEPNGARYPVAYRCEQ